jgi:hypothetical protein
MVERCLERGEETANEGIKTSKAVCVTGKGRLSAKRRWMELEVEGGRARKTECDGGSKRRKETRTCLLARPLARRSSVFRVEIISIGGARAFLSPSQVGSAPLVNARRIVGTLAARPHASPAAAAFSPSFCLSGAGAERARGIAKRRPARQLLHRIAPSRSQSVIACLTGRQRPRPPWPSSSLRAACAPCFVLHFQDDVIAALWLLE